MEMFWFCAQDRTDADHAGVVLFDLKTIGSRFIRMKFLITPSKKSAVVGLVIVFLTFLGFSFHYLYNSPVVGASFSWNPSDKHYQVASSESWSPLRTGDTVLAIGNLRTGFMTLLMDNIHIESRGDFFLWLEAKRQVFRLLNQPSVPFQVLRDGRKTEIFVFPRKAELSFLAHMPFLHIVVGIVFFLIGLIVFYKKDSGEESYVFLAMSLLIMLIFISNATSLMADVVYQPDYLAIMNIINILSLPMGNAALFHLCLFLPRKKKAMDRFPWLMPLFYLVCIAIVATFHIRTINFLTGTLSTMTVAVMIHAFFINRQPLERQQMKWVFAGVLFGLGPWVLLNGIPLLVTGRRLVDDTITGACVAFIPLSMAFAIRKYRLMDIDAFLEGAFVYTVTILLLFVADLCIFSLVGAQLASPDSVGNMLLHPILIISLYVVFRDRIGFLLRKVFKRIPLSEADTIAMLSRKAAGLRTDEILRVLGVVLKEAFRLQTFMMIREGDSEIQDLLSFFHGRSGEMNLWENARLFPLTNQGFYVALAFAPVDKMQPHTLFLLGAVSGKYFYSRHELAILHALYVQAQTLHENAILHEKMLKECNARLIEEQRHVREKEIMLKDLHDGIGGLVANIHLLAETARRNSSLPAATLALTTVSDLSQKGISEINSFLLSLDPVDATYETLIAELQHSGNAMIVPHGMQFRLESSLETPERQTGRLVFYNVLKIYKETLTNVVKHAGAQSVLVQVFLKDDLFTLSVADDGGGMNPGKIKGRGIENMKTRAKDMGGRLRVLSEQGTRICLDVPVGPPGAIKNSKNTEMEDRA